MNVTRGQAALAISAIVIGVAGLASAATANVVARTDHVAPTQSATPSSDAGRAVNVHCNGGASKSLRTVASDDPYTHAGTHGVGVKVPSTQVQIQGPTTGTDTVLVTYSAEVNLQNPTANESLGWVGVQARLDGVGIEPSPDGTTNPLAFGDLTGLNHFESNSAQFCTTIGPGLHTFAIFANSTGKKADEIYWLDDYLTSYQVFD